VENVPLADATNVFALTATDAWGNSATTNITVCQSSLTLGITPIDPNQLFQPTVSLTGTVSDPTCTVWVNGIQATNNGDGTWQATGVPVTPGGTASFVVSAYPAGHDLQADAASLAKINDDLPDRLYVESDHQSLATDDHTYWPFWINRTGETMKSTTSTLTIGRMERAAAPNGCPRQSAMVL